jgi:hypothetical protein
LRQKLPFARNPVLTRSSHRSNQSAAGFVPPPAASRHHAEAALAAPQTTTLRNEWSTDGFRHHQATPSSCWTTEIVGQNDLGRHQIFLQMDQRRGAGNEKDIGARRSSQASATRIGVVPRLAATADKVDDCSGLKPPSGKNGP